MNKDQVKNSLRIERSAFHAHSITRRLGDVVVRRLSLANQAAALVNRGLSRDAWIDMICHSVLTFHYTESGPQGLLKDRPAYLVLASGSENAAHDMLEQWLPVETTSAVA